MKTLEELLGKKPRPRPEPTQELPPEVEAEVEVKGEVKTQTSTSSSASTPSPLRSALSNLGKGQSNKYAPSSKLGDKKSTLDIGSTVIGLGETPTPNYTGPSPSSDPELASERDKSILYYQNQLEANEDNPLLRTLYTHLLDLVSSLQSDEVTDTFRQTMEFLQLNSELDGILLPRDIKLMVRALQISSGRVLQKKTARSNNRAARAERIEEAAKALFDIDLGV